MMEEMQQEWFGETADGGSRFSWLRDGVFAYMMDVDKYIHTFHQPAPNSPLEEWEFLENCARKSIREYVEHGYAVLESVMGITVDPKQWFLIASRPYVVDIYISCLLFNIIMYVVLGTSVLID